MFSNLSTTINEPILNYQISDSSLPFSEYIAHNRAIIEERRTDLQQAGSLASLIVNANSPYEFYPLNPIKSGNRLKYGVLLLHGLLDCPFSLKDMAMHLQGNGILCRSILLPGHGTTPEDLLSVSYHDWIQALRYGIDSLRKEVDQIFLAGFSTGAALSVYQALQDSQISGIILLAPAIKIKAPVSVMVLWHQIKKWLKLNDSQWLYQEKEQDYTKYLSIPFHAVKQVALLTEVLKELRQHHTLTCPIFMAVSREDETISSHRAIDFFSGFHNQESKLLLYTSIDHAYPDPRIITRVTKNADLNINHFSHVSIPFAPGNHHYGQHGDYQYASHINNEIVYGAYNRMEADIFDQLYKLKLCNNRHRQLTYNPDFNHMADQITKFITS